MFVAAAGFLFGQLFFNTFDWPATIAGVSGLLAGALSGRVGAEVRRLAPLIVILCLAGLVGVALDARDYYAHYDIPGNYYAWFMIGPYCCCLVVIALTVLLGRSPGRSVREALRAMKDSHSAGKSFGLLEYLPGFSGLPAAVRVAITIVLVCLSYTLFHWLSGR